MKVLIGALAFVAGVIFWSRARVLALGWIAWLFTRIDP